MAPSDSSALSTPPSSDGEEEPPMKIAKAKTLKLKGGKLTAASANTSPLSSPEPPPPPREPTPPHEYVLADNPDIATVLANAKRLQFLVMFRSRFNELFPKNVPNLGPQDIENGVVGSVPSEQIENLLCALLGLLLNRKKYVERGHHGRALEEAISTQRHQWPRSWGGVNPLPGTRTFSDMDPTERLALLKTLALWSLNTSEAVSGIIKESYKQSRHDDDLNQPRSVQPWGSDGRKRRYWLIEGQNDTPFRLYQEGSPKLVRRTWWSIAGNLDELKTVGDNLRSERSQAGRRLADSITAAIPRLEETLEKRKRKEYRQARRAAFSRPEPGFSLYEGRTRGKRMKYTFSDDEDTSDVNSTRRSTRQSDRSTPAEFGGPTVTSSGRQVRSRFGRSYGDPMQASSEAENSNMADSTTHISGRPRRSAANGLHNSNRSESITDDEMSDGDDAPSSGEEWGGNDDDPEGKLDEDDDDSSDNESGDSLMDEPGSLVVILKYRKDRPSAGNQEKATVNGFTYEAPDPTKQNPSLFTTSSNDVLMADGPKPRSSTDPLDERIVVSRYDPPPPFNEYPGHDSPAMTRNANEWKLSQPSDLPSLPRMVDPAMGNRLPPLVNLQPETHPKPAVEPEIKQLTPPAELTQVNGSSGPPPNTLEPAEKHLAHSTLPHFNSKPAAADTPNQTFDAPPNAQQQELQNHPPAVQVGGPPFWSNQAQMSPAHWR